jgi:hypothetical protein
MGVSRTPSGPSRYSLVSRHGATDVGRCIMPQLLSRTALSKGIFGAAAVTLTFGAVQFASGRDLSGISQIPVTSAEAAINRAAKTDRATGVARSSAQMQTISLRVNGLADTSVLLRVPVAQATRPSSSLLKGTGERKVACEPVVSVLTEVAKQLQPGRCVT